MPPELSPELKTIYAKCDSAQGYLRSLQAQIEDLRAKPYNAREIETTAALFLRDIAEIRRIQESRDATLIV